MSLKSHQDIELKNLIYCYSFNPYRHYPFLKKEQKKEAMYLKMMSCLQKDGKLLKIKHQGKKALAIVRKLPWDSVFFNIPMGAIEAILPEENKESLISVIFDETLSWFETKKIKHVTFKVDTADIKSIFVAQKKGFYLVDTIVTYLTVKNYTVLRQIKPLFILRPFEEKDYPEMMRIVEYAFKNYPSRFNVDPHLPTTGTLELYKSWIDNLIKQPNGYLIVGERKGKVVGFLGYFSLPELCQVTGKLHVGKTISAVGPKGEGCYAQFISTLGEAPYYPDTVEGDTSITNTMIQNMWLTMAIIHGKVIRSKYVFHYYFK